MSAESLATLVKSALAGNVRAAARLITLAESGGERGRDALAEIYPHTGRAHIVGVTGVPGSGKSTLLRLLARLARARGRKVAIVAIDPSSPFSGGAILGDRIRMNDLAGDPGIFIRSMATRGALGGLARATLDAADILDAAGYDYVFLETVGVGQDEVDVARAAHTTVVVSAPGLGDDIQAIKAGILEIADIHVVSKADRADANRTVTELKGMLTLSLALDGAAAWPPPVIATSAEEESGIEPLLDTIESHRDHLRDSGEIEARRRDIAAMRILKIAEEIVRLEFEKRRGAALGDLVTRVSERRLDPRGAAAALITALKESAS